MQPDPLAAAVRQCPFLALVGAQQGEQYARNLAANPFARASAGPLLLEEGYAATLRLFHGPGGVVPLRRFDATAADAAPASGGCPFHAAAAEAKAQHASTASSSSLSPEHAVTTAAVPAAQCRAGAAATTHSAPSPLARAPFASISISGFGFVPDPGQLFNRPPRAKQQQQQRKPADPGNSRAGTTGNSSTNGGSGSSGRPGAASGGSPGVSSGGSSGSSGRLHPAAGAPGKGGCTSAWGRAIGGLIPLAANGQLSCPAPIVKMRAVVAALKPVRQLRPQALPIRALAMGGTAIAANLPCGAWREHTKKFSPQWFLAVHATIPFVAMLRKAVLMPKWAILLTVAGAIAGQNVGARMERKRVVSRRQAGRSAARDCVMPSLDDGCRRCLNAAQAAIAWTLAPVVVS